MILFVWIVMWVYLQDISCGSLVGFVFKSAVICSRFASCQYSAGKLSGTHPKSLIHFVFEFLIFLCLWVSIF